MGVGSGPVRSGITSTLYHSGNKLAAGDSASFYSPRDTTSRKVLIPFAQAGVVDLGIMFHHTLSKANAISFTASTDVVGFTSAHGYSIGDPVVFAGVVGGAPIVGNTTYYVLTVPDSTHVTLSASPGGATLNITTDGTATGLAIAAKVQIYTVIDETTDGASGTVSNGVILWPNTATDLTSDGRYYFLAERGTTTIATTAAPATDVIEIPELRLPIHALYLSVLARSVPDTGDVKFRLIRRY